MLPKAFIEDSVYPIFSVQILQNQLGIKFGTSFQKVFNPGI